MLVQTIPTRASALDPLAHAHERASGISWGAVFARAAAVAALSFILLILGVGLGLSSISPYSRNATAIGGPTIAWQAFMQLAALGIGGYLAGRLRVKWVGVHLDEVHLRDTAHGLLAWSIATLATVGILTGGVAPRVRPTTFETCFCARRRTPPTPFPTRNAPKSTSYSPSTWPPVPCRATTALIWPRSHQTLQPEPTRRGA